MKIFKILVTIIFFTFIYLFLTTTNAYALCNADGTICWTDPGTENLLPQEIPTTIVDRPAPVTSSTGERVGNVVTINDATFGDGYQIFRSDGTISTCYCAAGCCGGTTEQVTPVQTFIDTSCPLCECRCEDNIECCSGYKEWDGNTTSLFISIKKKNTLVPGPYTEYKGSGNSIVVDVGDTVYFYPGPAFRRTAQWIATFGAGRTCGWAFFDAAKTHWNCPGVVPVDSAAWTGRIEAFQYSTKEFFYVPIETNYPVVNVAVRDCDRIDCGNWSACNSSGIQTRICTQKLIWSQGSTLCLEDRSVEGRPCAQECTAGEEVSCYGEPIIYSDDGLTWSSAFSPYEYYPAYDPSITYSGSWSGGIDSCYVDTKDAGCHGDDCWYYGASGSTGYVKFAQSAGSEFTMPFRGNKIILTIVGNGYLDLDNDVFMRSYADVYIDGVFKTTISNGGTPCGRGQGSYSRTVGTWTFDTTEGEHVLRYVHKGGTYRPAGKGEKFGLVASILGIRSIEVYSSCNPQGTCPSNPWWQAVGGDVQTNGDLQSNVPTGNVLIDDGAGGYPGVGLYGGLTANTGNGDISNQGWLANSVYNGRVYDSEYFRNLIPSDTVMNSLPQTIGSSDISGGTASGGYTWFTHDGDLTIGSDITLSGGQKAIVFVNGNLNINANVTLNAAGDDFIIFLVGKDADGNGGNIIVDPAATNIDGMYLADDRFNSGVGDQQLVANGSITAWGGVVLGREISGSADPSEQFVFSPGLVMAFPNALSRERIVWREVAP